MGGHAQLFPSHGVGGSYVHEAHGELTNNIQEVVHAVCPWCAFNGLFAMGGVDWSEVGEPFLGSPIHSVWFCDISRGGCPPMKRLNSEYDETPKASGGVPDPYKASSNGTVESSETQKKSEFLGQMRFFFRLFLKTPFNVIRLFYFVQTQTHNPQRFPKVCCISCNTFLESVSSPSAMVFDCIYGYG